MAIDEERFEWFYECVPSTTMYRITILKHKQENLYKFELYFVNLQSDVFTDVKDCICGAYATISEITQHKDFSLRIWRNGQLLKSMGDWATHYE